MKATNLGTIERALSGLLGAFLFKKSAEASGLAKLPLALLGGAALARSLSGHSKLYASLGISSAEGVGRLLHPELPAAPALPLVVSIEVAKPRDAVYEAILALPEQALPKEEILAIHRDARRVRAWLDDGHGMMEYELELVRETSGQEIAFRGRPSDRISSGEIHLADSEAGTQVTVLLRRTQSWLRNIGSAIGVDHDHKVVSKYLNYLKGLLEDGSISAEGHAHVAEDGATIQSREPNLH
jgi:uncharacterized membrane protein